ncbi:MAG: hypothetical protein U9O94_06385 [Nanoarchaeota archaeon]|nr:hypothetical protein [Nanoarchaeota archaeon]
MTSQERTVILLNKAKETLDDLHYKAFLRYLCVMSLEKAKAEELDVAEDIYSYQLGIQKAREVRNGV